MELREPSESEEDALRLRTELLTHLLKRLRAQGFEVGVEYGGGTRVSWEPWLVVPGRAEISCEISDGPLFTIGPHPYQFAEDVTEAMGIIRAR